MRGGHLSTVLGFSWIVASIAMASTSPSQTISGNLRVSVLSESIVRIEQKGPNGWEDRPTFHIVHRPAPPKPGERSPARIQVGANFIEVAANAKTLADVKIVDKQGKIVWKWDGSLPNSVALPAPGKMPKSWWFADAPRIVPPAWGLAPAPAGQPIGSGWDLSNDAPDVYIFLPNGHANQLRRDVLTMTGPPELIPRYALGYMQSRYHAYSQKDVTDMIARYRKEDLPISLFVIDTDWRVGASHGYGENLKLFPDMVGLFTEMKKLGVRSMFNDHPEPQAKTALDPKELAYRTDGLAGWLKKGLDVWWYDRNWNVGLVEPLPGLRKEVWGMKLYRDITADALPGLRPLIMANVDGVDNGKLNRPSNIAAHRYSIQWTGDTGSTFAFLRAGVENALITGYQSLLPYVSEDLGGHVGNPNAEQYVRWMQYGALSPTMRLHYTAGMKDREPWNYPQQTREIVRDYIQMRYALTPYLYTASHASYITGLPLMRRLDLEFATEAKAAANDQYLLGPDLLVAPILTGQEAKAIPSTWWNGTVRAEYWDNTTLAGKPVVARKETKIDFDWEMNAPAPKLPKVNYSTRFTGVLTVPANSGAVKLVVATDDGCRIWVDGKQVLNEWRGQVATFDLPGTFEPGKSYAIKVEHNQLGGGALLQLRAVPVSASLTQKRSVWIPPGSWVNLWTGKTETGPKAVSVTAGLNETPMWARAGSIVPLQPVSHDTLDRFGESIILDVFPDAKGDAKGTLYEDDGISRDYEDGKGRTIEFSVRAQKDGAVQLSSTTQGSYESPEFTQRVITLRIHGTAGPVTKIGGPIVRDGAAIPFLRASTVRDVRTVTVDASEFSRGLKLTLPK